MKIIYLSSTFYADCDFPLIHELQSRGHDVSYYFSLASFNLKSTIFSIEKLYPHTGIYPAEIYDELKVFSGEIDLSKCFVINKKHKQKYHPVNLLLMARLALRIIFSGADIIHVTSAPRLSLKLLYLKKNKLVYTVHDPFNHTGETSRLDENARITAFRKIRRLILLNKEQLVPFTNKYNIPPDHIFLSHLGSYDTITRIPPSVINENKPFILFYGRVSWYKGLDVLLEAMYKVKKECPELKLIVAGSGKLWFDITPFKDIGNIEFKLNYVSLSELAALLKNCEFLVCPYREATQSGVVQTSLTMKTPVMVTSVGALPTSVGNGKYGYVIDDNTPDGIANAIIDLYRNPERLSMMRNAISTEWVPLMSWSFIADDYLNCYNLY